MLSALTIQNVVLIDRLHIEFKNGLCALTGETGAGKSILLDSLGLALGARAESGLVRKNTDQASVSATFEVPQTHIVYTLLQDADITVDSGEDILLKRILSKDGRSKAYINDQPVSAGLLRSVGETLLEIHGQFETQGLLNPASHREMLDEYANVDGALGQAWDTFNIAQKKLDKLKNAALNSREHEHYLRASLEDLDALEPKSGEGEILVQTRERLMHREQVVEGLNIAFETLNGEDDPVRKSWATLERLADKLGQDGQGAIEALERASAEIQEALSEIQRVSSNIDAQENDLQKTDDRLFNLRAQARKHNCDIDDLAAVREKLAQELNNIEHAEDHLATAMKDVENNKAAYVAMAEKISEQRQSAAIKLDTLVATELPPLKLEKARFLTDIQRLEENDWGAHGMDRVRFLVATNPNSEPGALNKIASGGEMSRFMLALKVVMAEVGSAQSLIFDEVDAGIGGGTADAVGERLAKLAQDKQIIVVTHAPQVAARASHHYIVSKSGDQDLKTTVIALDSTQARREEIARMLAGAVITPEARAAADKLLESSATTQEAA